MPIVDTEISIEYGGFIIGGTTDRIMDSKIQLEDSFESAAIEFSFVIAKNSEADFNTEIGLVEDAFRVPDQLLEFKINAAVMKSLSQTGNTGLDAVPRILKREDKKDTGRSRRYTVRIEFGRPADNIGTSGRRTHTVEVAHDESRRRTITISGVYTAIPPATSARAAYDAGIGGFQSGIITAVGGVYDLTTETAEENRTDKLLNFSRTLLEIKKGQAGAAADDPAVINQSLIITRQRVGPGDSLRNTRRFTTLIANYSASISFDVTTDLDSKWDSIPSFIVSEAEALHGLSGVAVTREEPSFDLDGNRITAVVEMIGFTGSSVLQSRVTTTVSTNFGFRLPPAWTGDPESKYDFQGPKILKQIVACSVIFRGIQPVPGFGDRIGCTSQEPGVGGGINVGVGVGINPPANRPGPGGGGAGQTRTKRSMSLDVTQTPITFGIQGYQLDATEMTETFIVEHFKSIGAGVVFSLG